MTFPPPCSPAAHMGSLWLLHVLPQPSKSPRKWPQLPASLEPHSPLVPFLSATCFWHLAFNRSIHLPAAPGLSWDPPRAPYFRHFQPSKTLKQLCSLACSMFSAQTSHAPKTSAKFLQSHTSSQSHKSRNKQLHTCCLAAGRDITTTNATVWLLRAINMLK